MMEMTDAEFCLLRDLVRRLTGIHLHESKKLMLSNRLRRLVKGHSHSTFMAYYQTLESRRPEALAALIDAVTTRTTEFFRFRSQIDYFAAQILPALARRLQEDPQQHATVWSAGCSSGEEVYTLALCVLERLPRAMAERIRVEGTDVSRKAIEDARTGRYPPRRIAALEPDQLARYFEPAPDGSWRAGAALRAQVAFQEENLIALRPRPPASVDVVFCRNVLIYFGEPERLERLAAMAAALKPGGYLLLGAAEMLLDDRPALEHVAPSVYRKP